MGLADLFGSIAHAAVDSFQGQQDLPAKRRLKTKKKRGGGCTPCQAQKRVDLARKRVGNGQL